MNDTSGLSAVPGSQIEHDGTAYNMLKHSTTHERFLHVDGDTSDFEPAPGRGPSVMALSAGNAAVLRQRLSWLKPVPLGLTTSAGFGDRLGQATPGHVAAVRGTGVAPIFAQQSVRENARTGRTPQQVLDDAMWAVFETGWRDPWGADADHLKQPADVKPFADAGYTFYTVDPGDHVDDAAETDDVETLRVKVARLDWQALHSTWEQAYARYASPQVAGLAGGLVDGHALLKAFAKYGAAIVHAARVTRAVSDSVSGGAFEMEVSVDETGTTTSLLEHVVIAGELIRMGVPFISLAPRFVGRFEKGVDYIGDLAELERNIAGHAAIMRHYGNRYKLSLHTGSDKFGVYPLAMRHTNGRVHLKTAGTSYLEALRLMAQVDPALFRRVLDFARSRYETDRKTYHVSAEVERVPESAALSNEQLPALLDDFDARQVLHVTFGSVLDTFGPELHALIRANDETYADLIKRHFDKHLAPLARR